MKTSSELEKILKQRQSWQRPKHPVRSSSKFQFQRPIRAQDITDFTRQLSTMMAAHLPLTRCLEVLEKQQKNSRFKQIIHDILQQVRSGKSFSDSVFHYSKLFHSFYVNMLRIGEIGGNMAKVLLQLSLYLEKMSGLKRKLITAMTYPAVIILVAIGAFSFLLFGVMPSFMEMFQDFGTDVPLPIKICIGAGHFLKSNMVFILIFLVGVIGVLKMLVNTEKGRWSMDVLKLRIPLLRILMKKVIVARFARTLGTLLQSGVSLMQALEVTGHAVGNQVFQKQILHMKKMASKGEPMEKSIADSNLFPILVVQMIGVDEETAELPDMLIKTAEFYEGQVDSAIEALTSIIEPVIIVVLGVILGGMMITIYLQIFDLMNVIQ